MLIHAGRTNFGYAVLAINIPPHSACGKQRGKAAIANTWRSEGDQFGQWVIASQQCRQPRAQAMAGADQGGMRVRVQPLADRLIKVMAISLGKAAMAFAAKVPWDQKAIRIDSYISRTIGFGAAKYDVGGATGIQRCYCLKVIGGILEHCVLRKSQRRHSSGKRCRFHFAAAINQPRKFGT